MRKYLILTSLLLAAIIPSLRAQSLFEFQSDTVCVRQPVQLTTSVTGASSYYWSFCSGYLQNVPTASTIVNSTLTRPAAIEIARDGNRYWGFTVDYNTATNTASLIRLDFGTSLSNVPVQTNLGNLLNTVPRETNTLHLLRDNANNWVMFAAGGTTAATASLARIDFGTSLANTPSSVNFGNLNSAVFTNPRGLYIFSEGGSWYGYVLNRNGAASSLLRLNFGANISLTPTIASLGNVGGGILTDPTDMAPIREPNGNWYFFVTNRTSNSIARIDFGTSLLNTPTGVNITPQIGNNGATKLFNPSSIALIRDCGNLYAFVTNALSGELVRIDMQSATGTYTMPNSAVLSGTAGTLNTPLAISGILRDTANLYALATNQNGPVSRIAFASCNTIVPARASNRATPPVFYYSQPGRYNVYLTTNEGLPTQQTDCKQITVLPIPGMTLSNDTLICQGDTILLVAQSVEALSQRWRPGYAITDTTVNTVRVYPDYTVAYRIFFPYANGCRVDTVINVTVSKNKADAGPDRVISDGAKTLVGGPLTTRGPGYTYQWIPANFVEDPTQPFTNVYPPNNFTYYLEVTNEAGCKDIDTMVVRVECDNLNLPNAFTPSSGYSETSRFGIMNKQIVKLNYFRVFDRWGKEVFSTTDVTKAWDGTVNGNSAQMGTYIWEADGFCNSGRRFKRSGNVTLIR